MSKSCKNSLKITPLADGYYLLQGGIIDGGKWKRIRERSKDLTALTKRKELLEILALANSGVTPGKRQLWTSLTQEQLEDAENAVRIAKGRSLYDAVKASEGLHGPVNNRDCQEALTEWLETLLREGHFESTTISHRHKVGRFLRECKAKTLAEVTPQMVHTYVFRKGVSQVTQISLGSSLRAYFNFCIRQEWLRFSPFKINMDSLGKRARAVTNPRILSAAQCQALLTAAAQVRASARGDGVPEGAQGVMLPYTILALWCFMRPSEITGVKASKKASALGAVDAAGVTPESLRKEKKGWVIAINPHKKGTGRTRDCSIPANVAELLQDCIKRGLWEAGKAPYYTRATWEKVQAAAGVISLGKRKSEHGKKERLSSEWQVDIMRHTGISYLYKSGEVMDEVTRQAGNSAEVVFAHYFRLATEEEAAAFYKVSASLPAAVTQLSGESAA